MLTVIVLLGVAAAIWESCCLWAVGLPFRGRQYSYRRHLLWTHVDYWAPWIAARAYQRAGAQKISELSR